MENLIKIATDIYRAYFANGQRVVWYYSNIKPSQTGIKIKTSDYTELEDAYNKLRFNGILLIETDLSLIDVLEIIKTSEIVYNNELNNEFIIIK